MESLSEYISSLPQEDLAAVAERVISHTLSAKFGCPIYVSIEQTEEGKVLEMFGIRNMGIDVAQFKINQREIPAKVVRQIINRTSRALSEQMVKDEFLRLRSGIGRNVEGEISRINSVTREILVHINGGVMREWYGSFPLSEQPVHERTKYRVGQSIELHVVSANIITNGSSQVRITLSRRCKGYIEQLMYRLLFEQGEDLSQQKLCCIKRKPGFFSIVSATTRFPREIYVLASREAGERILVSLNGTEIRSIKRGGHA